MDRRKFVRWRIQHTSPLLTTCTNYQIRILDPKLWEARSLLYRSRFWRPNTHFAAFFEIYKMCKPLHRSGFKISVVQLFSKMKNELFIIEKSLTIFDWNFEPGAVQRFANLVDLEKCCKMRIWMQKSALIQTRTSLLKLGVPHRSGRGHVLSCSLPHDVFEQFCCLSGKCIIVFQGYHEIWRFDPSWSSSIDGLKDSFWELTRPNRATWFREPKDETDTADQIHQKQRDNSNRFDRI